MNYTLEEKNEYTWTVNDSSPNQKEVYKIDNSLYLTDGNVVLLAEDENHLSELLNNRALEKVSESWEEYYIGGFRVFNIKPEEEVIIKGIDLPLYKRRKDSDAIYAAGFYCIKYDTGWKHGQSIMLTTLQRYDYRGPFHTLEKAYSVLQEVRKEDAEQSSEEH